MHDPEQFRPAPSSVYIWANTGEDRAQHRQRWDRAAVDLVSIELSEVPTNEAVPYQARAEVDGISSLITLRDGDALSALLDRFPGRPIYFDITGIANGIWAPLLRVAASRNVPIRALYAEPKEYRVRPGGSDSDVFDLSERIRGVSPVAGFTVMREPPEGSDYLVPLLGFEGTRLLNVIEHVQPSNDHIIPIFGLPGFLPEYPFHTFRGNGAGLRDTRAWRRVRYALADSPFAAYFELEDVLEEVNGAFLKISPLGTRPHVLAAVVFAISYPDHSELVYDHPKDSPNRTSGIGRIHEYDVSAMLLASSNR